MAWKYFGLEAIRFTRYDLVLEELVQAFMERRGITRPLCPQGTKITMQGNLIFTSLHLIKRRNSSFIGEQNEISCYATLKYMRQSMEIECR